ncbi:hypothetical protein AK812_SmicGene35384 [Symbiodinium microadriaticum]|uniref:Uncharacterized protein n=1 Tax=Symbiodinium microadriaticum TaxID=2951 RepID=A0A1Q9CLM1_SYMMI|nr:hypothetical protein AK812_SmicGene35384 [Symbiodinium microadriaticum]
MYDEDHHSYAHSSLADVLIRCAMGFRAFLRPRCRQHLPANRVQGALSRGQRGDEDTSGDIAGLSRCHVSFAKEAILHELERAVERLKKVQKSEDGEDLLTNFQRAAQPDSEEAAKPGAETLSVENCRDRSSQTVKRDLVANFGAEHDGSMKQPRKASRITFEGPEDAVPREILAALQVLLQSRDQVLQDALSGVSVRDQARLRFLLGRLQLRRDVQELDYVPQLAPLSSQSGSRVSRAVDAFVQVEQATATVSELGVQSEAPSFSSQETQTINQGLYAQVMEHLVSLAPPGQPKMTFAAVVQKAPPQPRTAAGQGNFHGQLGPLSKSATGKGGASRTSSTTQEPRHNVFQDTAPVAKAATFQTSSVPQESAQDSAQDTPPVVQDPPLAGVALTQETAAVQDVLQSDAASGFPTAAAVGTQERRDSRGPCRRERQPRTVVRLPLHFKGKGKGSSFDRFGYRPALDNLGEQAPLSGMAGFLALARQENLPPPGAPTSLIAQYKGFLFAPLSVVGFDGQLPVGRRQECRSFRSSLTYFRARVLHRYQVPQEVQQVLQAKVDKLVASFPEAHRLSVEASEDTPRRLSPEERSSRIQAVQARLGSWPIGGAFEPSHWLIDHCSGMIREQCIKYVAPSKCSSRDAEVTSVRRDDHLLRLENSTVKLQAKNSGIRVDLSTDLRLYQAVARRGLAMEVAGICSQDAHEKTMRVLFDHLHRAPPPNYVGPTADQFLRSDRELWRLVSERVGHGFANAGGSKLVDTALLELVHSPAVSFHLYPLPKPQAPAKRPWEQDSQADRHTKGKNGKGKGKWKGKVKGKGDSGKNVPSELKGLSGTRNGIRLCFNFNMAHGCTLECKDINGNPTCARGAHLCMKCGGSCRLSSALADVGFQTLAVDSREAQGYRVLHLDLLQVDPYVGKEWRQIPPTADLASVVPGIHQEGHGGQAPFTGAAPGMGILFGWPITGSVWNFIRVAIALWAAGAQVLQVPWTTFYDDFTVVSLQDDVRNLQASIFLFFQLLGWKVAVEGDKAAPFSTLFQSLGVLFDLSRSSTGQVIVSNTERRREEVRMWCLQVLKEDQVSPAMCAAFASRVRWLESQMHGRLGRIALQVLLSHASPAKSTRPTVLTRELKWAVTWILNHVPDARPKVFRNEQNDHFILFTDGAVEEGTASLGGVLLDDGGSPLHYFSCQVPKQVYQEFEVGQCVSARRQFEADRSNKLLPLAAPVLGTVESSPIIPAIASNGDLLPASLSSAEVDVGWDNQTLLGRFDPDDTRSGRWRQTSQESSELPQRGFAQQALQQATTVESSSDSGGSVAAPSSASEDEQLVAQAFTVQIEGATTCTDSTVPSTWSVVPSWDGGGAFLRYRKDILTLATQMKRQLHALDTPGEEDEDLQKEAGLRPGMRADALDVGENLAAEAAAKKVQEERERWEEERQALELRVEELKAACGGPGKTRVESVEYRCGAKWSTLRERFVLTNKGDAELDSAELKGRWIFGGHRDPDAIHFEAQVLDFVWRVKVPAGYPEEVVAFLDGLKQFPWCLDCFVPSILLAVCGHWLRHMWVTPGEPLKGGRSSVDAERSNASDTFVMWVSMQEYIKSIPVPRGRGGDGDAPAQPTSTSTQCPRAGLALFSTFNFRGTFYVGFISVFYLTFGRVFYVGFSCAFYLNFWVREVPGSLS